MKAFFQANNPKRHKLVATGRRSQLKGLREEAPRPPIESLDVLKERLQTAIQIEHLTIPPYLCALYSIKEGTNAIASSIIRSVVVEEMLHMVLAANILNAIGGTPRIYSKEFARDYPASLPHDDTFEVNLQKFSKDAIRTFLKIEKPAANSSLESIGKFYDEIRMGLRYCNENTKGGIFIRDEGRQVTSEHYYGSGGKLTAVYTLEDANLAMDEIVGQGEGIDGTINDPDDALFGEDIEYAHFFRFNEILHERFYRGTDAPQDFPSGKKINVDWDAVYNMEQNPKMANYEKGSELWKKSRSFNQTYMALLKNIDDACSGQAQLLMQGITLMYDLKYKAVELMKTPIGKGKLMAGPSFEYVNEKIS